MNNFTYARATDIGQALQEVQAHEAAKFIAGGTNLVDLMKYNVMRPARLIDITRLPLKTISDLDGGGLRLGALVTNADTAYHPSISQRYPLLADAILSGASPQIRNMATNGGNLLQRTRCYYFYDTGTPCNKREPGTGCPAILGLNRMHAIIGASEQCIAVHPSDMCVALAALDAVVHVTGKGGERAIPLAEFHRLPRDAPHIDTTLLPDDVVVAIDLPPKGFADHYTYLKIRDRASYAFAIVSVAAALDLDGNHIEEARLALGGIAHKPWRDREAERMLIGKPATRANFQTTAEYILRDAKGYEHNRFKIELAKRAIVRALAQAAAGTPQTIADKKIV